MRANRDAERVQYFQEHQDHQQLVQNGERLGCDGLVSESVPEHFPSADGPCQDRDGQQEREDGRNGYFNSADVEVKAIAYFVVSHLGHSIYHSRIEELLLKTTLAPTLCCRADD